MLESLLVVSGIKRPGRVEIDSQAGMHASNRHPAKRRRIRWVSMFDRVVQYLGDRGTPHS